MKDFPRFVKKIVDPVTYWFGFLVAFSLFICFRILAVFVAWLYL